MESQMRTGDTLFATVCPCPYNPLYHSVDPPNVQNVSDYRGDRWLVHFRVRLSGTWTRAGQTSEQQPAGFYLRLKIAHAPAPCSGLRLSDWD